MSEIKNRNQYSTHKDISGLYLIDSIVLQDNGSWVGKYCSAGIINQILININDEKIALGCLKRIFLPVWPGY